MEGIINVLKPPGMTSHDVISFLRRTLSIRKIGHSGTLDPQAAGVLPVCVGDATRLADYLGNGRKSYFCEMTLGIATDTEDAWGAAVCVKPVPALSKAEIESAALNFVGQITQQVPAYSAIKVQGQPLYKAARRGEETAAIFRNVHIYELKILKIRDEKIQFWVECGKGTYVRTLCRDLGTALGTVAHMSFLLRTSVGAFQLEQACTLEEITEKRGGLLQPKELAVQAMARIILTEEQEKQIQHGQSIQISAPSAPLDEEMACLNIQGKLIAIGNWMPAAAAEQGYSLIKPRKVFKS